MLFFFLFIFLLHKSIPHGIIGICYIYPASTFKCTRKYSTFKHALRIIATFIETSQFLSDITYAEYCSRNCTPGSSFTLKYDSSKSQKEHIYLFLHIYLLS